MMVSQADIPRTTRWLARGYPHIKSYGLKFWFCW